MMFVHYIKPTSKGNDEIWEVICMSQSKQFVSYFDFIRVLRFQSSIVFVRLLVGFFQLYLWLMFQFVFRLMLIFSEACGCCQIYI